jgi:hypothetical protein
VSSSLLGFEDCCGVADPSVFPDVWLSTIQRTFSTRATFISSRSLCCCCNVTCPPKVTWASARRAGVTVVSPTTTRSADGEIPHVARTFLVLEAHGCAVVTRASVCRSCVRLYGKIRMRRVIEYYVHVEGQDVPEMFCLVTDLHDWRQYPAAALAAAYRWRWDGPETALREAKSAIRGTGPSTGPIFRSHCPDLIRQEHAAWTCAAELVRTTARQAARRAAPARKGRRAGQPVHPREISFTAARRAAITTTRSGTATATLPAAITASRCQDTLRDLGRRRFTIDRNRHRDHKTKARQAFPAARRGTTTRKAPAVITVCGPIAA